MDLLPLTTTGLSLLVPKVIGHLVITEPHAKSIFGLLYYPYWSLLCGLFAVLSPQRGGSDERRCNTRPVGPIN